MRLIIAGGRDINVSSSEIDEYLSQHKLKPVEIVSGGASGVDDCAIQYGFKKNYKVYTHKADWVKFGRYAGPKRNREMAEFADALLLIWNGKSRGSANMKHQMEKLGKPVYEIIRRQNEIHTEGQ